MAVGIDHLRDLYADTSDPWGFEQSAYEQEKFAATRNALSRPYYQAILELGCGNGQLALHLSNVTNRYVGMDAVEKALEAARQAVPTGTFLVGYYPCPLPAETFELLVLSEILYFLDHAGLQLLARDIDARWPDAEVICVNYLGLSGNQLQGEESVTIFTKALATHTFECVVLTDGYRIDRGLPRDRT